MGAKAKKKKMSKVRVAFLLFCILPPLLHFLIFYIYPNISSFFMAFTNVDSEFSFDNFTRLFKEFTDPEVYKQEGSLLEGLRNTAITFGLLVVTFPFKVLVSYFIYKKVPGSKFFRIVFFLPTIIFSVAMMLIFQQLVGVDSFIAEWVQKTCGLSYVPDLLADSDFANTVILLNLLWIGFPGDLIIWGGTFARIPEDVLESGRVDGTTWWTEFTKIIVPMVWPTVALQMVLLACGFFGASGSVFLLTKGQYGTMTFAAWQYLELYEYSGSQYTSNIYNYLSAVGLATTVIAVTLSVVVRKVANKVFEEVEF